MTVGLLPLIMIDVLLTVMGRGQGVDTMNLEVEGGMMSRREGMTMIGGVDIQMSIMDLHQEEGAAPQEVDIGTITIATLDPAEGIRGPYRLRSKRGTRAGISQKKKKTEPVSEQQPHEEKCAQTQNIPMSITDDTTTEG
ncbi:hypothetical protein ABW19_dt0205247 [Dactylella cylindrospora]|nr:hypothetical protein ABW19_dt0205247 [Dactylella cylindrospora]